jgi:glycosyltransferase involved in cell wall biosynthesis
MPYLPEAIQSVAAQSYPHIELVVQDGGSTDGSLEFLRSVNTIPTMRIESSRDSGIGDAYNKAIKRCMGEFIGTIDADNLLLKDSVASAVESFKEHPEAAAIYGASELIDPDGNHIATFQAAPFNRAAVMRCDLVMPFASSFFSKRVCDVDLRFEETMKTCADFELWLRLSDRPIIRLTHLFSATRLSSKSMTRNVENYDQFCKDKLYALKRHIDQHGEGLMAQVSLDLCSAGIYYWAAESIGGIEGISPRFEEYIRLASEHDSSFYRLQRLMFHFEKISSEPLLPILAWDLRRNLDKNGRQSFMTRLRIAAKLLLNRYSRRN